MESQLFHAFNVLTPGIGSIRFKKLQILEQNGLVRQRDVGGANRVVQRSDIVGISEE
jgi:hypothetical protein